MKKGKLIFEVDGVIEINSNLDDLKAAIECLEEGMQKLQEWGTAKLKYTITAEGDSQ